MAGLGFTRYSTGGSAVMLIDFYSINKATRLAVQWCGITPYLSGRSISVDSPSKVGERVICVRDITGSYIGRNTMCTDFFFYGHYNPLWVLAFSVIIFHSALSLHCFLHRLIPIICISSSISTIFLFLGLPLILVPIGFHSNILLGVLLSFIRIT